MRVYLDNASTTPLTDKVKEVLIDHINHDYGNPSSIHHHGRKSRSLIEKARKSIAANLKASVGEIFFTSSATEANNMILKRSILDLGVRHIVSSPTEHHCILHSLEAIANEHPEVEITFLPVDNKGSLNLEDLENILAQTDKKTIVSLMYGNNEIGTIHDIPSISEICQKHQAYLHSDAVQYISKRPIDVSENYYSFLTASAHKFHGPKGVGFFYMNEDNIIKPMIHGGAQERNMRAGTENLYGIVAMAEAFSEGTADQVTRMLKQKELKTYMMDRLSDEIEGVLFNGEVDDLKSLDHILSVSFPPSDKGDMLMFNLDIEGISASAGSACSSGIETDSHVLLAIGHPPDRKTIRFSFSHLNTIKEIDYTIDVLKKHT